MKITIAILISAIILLRSIPTLAECNLRTVNQVIPPRIFAETTVDGKDQAILLTRFLHNKPGIFLWEFSKCYLAFFEPNFIYQSVGLLGMISWFYLLFSLIKNNKWQPLLLLLALPILPFLGIFSTFSAYLHKVFAIIAIAVFIKSKK